MRLPLFIPAAMAIVALAIPLTADDSPSSIYRPRVIVETDAGGDPDDEQSLVRFLLYTNEFDVEGIIANRPRTRNGENENPERTGLGVVQRLVRAYGESETRLREHDPRFPAHERLLERVVPGYDDRDDGVQLILRAVDANDPRPLWFMNWGTDRGSAESCLKRALDRVLQQRGPQHYAMFKSRIYLSSSDEFGDHTMNIEPAFPIWVDTFRPEMDGRRWYHRFSALTATAGGFDIERDVRTGHGSLGTLYPTNTTHPQKEGDTMSFLYLVPTGMNDPTKPGWGSWAGRYGRMEGSADRNYYFANQHDTWNGTTSRDNTLSRWAVDLQNDFRARMDWCVRPYTDANHAPRVVVAGARFRHLKGGQSLSISADGSADPDKDKLHFSWEIYAEPGSSNEPLAVEHADQAVVTVVAPRVTAPAEQHLLLTVRDDGTPPLARYARIVVTLEPQSEP
jgi:hypothetical protein